MMNPAEREAIVLYEVGFSINPPPKIKENVGYLVRGDK